MLKQPLDAPKGLLVFVSPPERVKAQLLRCPQLFWLEMQHDCHVTATAARAGCLFHTSRAVEAMPRFIWVIACLPYAQSWLPCIKRNLRAPRFTRELESPSDFRPGPFRWRRSP